MGRLTDLREDLDRYRHLTEMAAKYKKAINLPIDDDGRPILAMVDDQNAYKKCTGIQRVPVAAAEERGTKDSTMLVGKEALAKAGILKDGAFQGKPMMDDARMKKLFSKPVVAEEKIDGHPVVVYLDDPETNKIDYTFFCENLGFVHTVNYEGRKIPPRSFVVDDKYGRFWPKGAVVYDIIEGPVTNFKPGKYKWLTRSEKEFVCDMVGAPLCPIVSGFPKKISPDDLRQFVGRQGSWSPAGEKAEGVVLKNLQDGIFGKFINKEFQDKITDDAMVTGKMHPEIRRQKHKW